MKRLKNLLPFLLITLMAVISSCSDNCEDLCRENLAHSKYIDGVWTKFKTEIKYVHDQCDGASWHSKYVNQNGETVIVWHQIHCN